MLAAIDTRSADRALWAGNPLVVPPAALDFEDTDVHAGLHVRVLRNARERQAIAHLRRHAAFGVEQDLGLDLKSFEQARDEAGMVMAVYGRGRLLASLRLVPTGYGLTGAERLLEKVPFDASILGAGSWEVGRMIMEPEDRHPDLLQQCLAVVLEEVMQASDARHFHATTTLAMARLWRRAGMRALFTTPGTSGTRYALVHGRVEEVAAALHLPHYVQERHELPAPARVPAARAHVALHA